MSFEAKGLTHLNDRSFEPEIANALRLWPHLTGMSGFFCALISKNSSIPSAIETAPERDFSRTGLVKVDMSQEAQVFEQIEEHYGLIMQEILSDYRVSLFQRHDQLFLIPDGYLRHFKQLPYVYIGMAFGSWTEETFEPAHEFVSRFGRQFTKGYLEIEAQHVAQWIAGRDIRYPDTNLKPEGQFLLVKDQAGRNLGMGKLLPRRLRNMLPRQSV